MYELEATLMLLKTERSQQNVEGFKEKVAYGVMTPTGGAVAGGGRGVVSVPLGVLSDCKQKLHKWNLFIQI